MTRQDGFWRAEADGVSVRVRVQPRARRAGLLGVQAAADGRANRAVCAAVAEALGVAPSAVAVALGASARQKTLRVAGDSAALAARLEGLA